MWNANVNLHCINDENLIRFDTTQSGNFKKRICHSDFMWNQFWQIWKLQKLSIWPFHRLIIYCEFVEPRYLTEVWVAKTFLVCNKRLVFLVCPRFFMLGKFLILVIVRKGSTPYQDVNYVALFVVVLLVSLLLKRREKMGPFVIESLLQSILS